MASLTTHQANRVWQKKFEAEVRSLYFGDLASRYTRRRQIITGVSFFLSSGAAATVIAGLPVWVPTLQAVIVAIATAYSIAVNLDKCIGTMAKLHSEWNHLAADYDRLWNHWRSEDASESLKQLEQRARDTSEIGTEMPYNAKAMDKWQDTVSSLYATAA